MKKFIRWTDKYLEVDDGDGNWKHYQHSVMFAPDYPTTGGSKGYATMQKCLNAGYQYKQDK